ncbi:LLM class flavin-dependent oxidoreductase [Nocardiopsis sp. L17-MgMaSL7]|uniref:LLM class flavin-dependent oxidoreductase n=1 Tax=Nocardiopsis sp. L17-MgMaSL7 TaxID=1938893 RepID=UPI000D70F1AF|nr:LLM class flavin-dependent oxidoreductase [Nocardiopsis sp. L17-MgMaSL7]PWV57619.1 alkanesulfonate monooxygenase SsuD/methylene tetrahydromethanopterin reductase-like flavin-dependent oxidoreductase (luciferase family) [Nocardiopsis sp. L17-MgMaSL7]
MNTAPAPRRVGAMLPRDLASDQVLDFARRAETLGFDELWVVEDLGFRGGVAQAGAVLASTSRIRVGIGILPAGARNAAFAAMEIATLAQLFPGRLTVGIGHGMRDWMEQVDARPASPLTLIQEYATALRTLLLGHPGPAPGRYVHAQDVLLDQPPAQVPPLVLGVRGPRSLAVAGRVADGVLLAEPANPAYIRAALAQVRSEVSGRAPMVITYDAAAVDTDPEAALERVRPALASVGDRDWAPHIAPLPFAEALTAHRAACSGPEEFAATLPRAWVEELSLAGTPEGVRAGIAARHDAGAHTVVLAPAGPDPRAELDRLGRVLEHRRR